MGKDLQPEFLVKLCLLILFSSFFGASFALIMMKIEESIPVIYIDQMEIPTKILSYILAFIIVIVCSILLSRSRRFKKWLGTKEGKD